MTSSGAFADAGAAIERVVVLEQAGAGEGRARGRAREAARSGENLDAYMERVREARDELRERVRVLDEAAAHAPEPPLLARLFGRR